MLERTTTFTRNKFQQLFLGDVFNAAKFVWWLYVLLINCPLVPYVASNSLLGYQHSYWFAAGGGYSGADIQTVAIKKARRLYHQQRVQFTLNSLSITKKALTLERPLRYL